MRQIIWTFTTLTVLAACNSFDKTPKLKSNTVLESKFDQLTQLTLANTTAITFRLDTLTNFYWDTVIILTPYYYIDKLEQKLKIDMTDIKNTQIVSDEVSNVLAFVKDGQLINYVDLPRNKGDFSHFTDSNRVVTKDNCHFELVQTDNKFVSGQKIAIVKLINNINDKGDRKNKVTSNKKAIENIKFVFDDYIKYQESTDSQDNKDLITKSLESLSKVTDQKELEILINVWMYYDPTDFPSRDLVFKVLENSRPESIDAIKTRIKTKKDWEVDDTAPYSELNDLLRKINK